MRDDDGDDECKQAGSLDGLGLGLGLGLESREGKGMKATR